MMPSRENQSEWFVPEALNAIYATSSSCEYMDTFNWSRKEVCVITFYIEQFYALALK